jgi:hypothetical protein
MEYYVSLRLIEETSFIMLRSVFAAPTEKSDLRGVGQREGEPAPSAIPRIKLVLLGDSVRVLFSRTSYLPASGPFKEPVIFFAVSCQSAVFLHSLLIQRDNQEDLSKPHRHS